MLLDISLGNAFCADFGSGSERRVSGRGGSQPKLRAPPLKLRVRGREYSMTSKPEPEISSDDIMSQTSTAGSNGTTGVRPAPGNSGVAWLFVPCLDNLETSLWFSFSELRLRACTSSWLNKFTRSATKLTTPSRLPARARCAAPSLASTSRWRSWPGLWLPSSPLHLTPRFRPSASSTVCLPLVLPPFGTIEFSKEGSIAEAGPS
mmetsp:Transcript_48093/g.122031  ORF Transcript_48093/g.122031 Transcript_48093/m.122031 type:complete len:205 (-) Transcript_48093:4-618(-)